MLGPGRHEFCWSRMNRRSRWPRSNTARTRVQSGNGRFCNRGDEQAQAIKGDVSAAIIDVGLPDRKGDILVSEIRAHYPSLPIVIASGYEGETLRARFRGDDRIAFLSKPYIEEQLRAVLASLHIAGK